MPLMPPTLHTITIDLLGFGKSPKPQWNHYSLNDHADAVAKTIRKLHLHQPAIIVGHSMGSLVAVAIAKRHPKLVKHLVLCSMPVYLNEITKDSVHSYTKRDRYINNTYFRIYEAIRLRPNFTLKNAERIKKIVGDNTSFNLNKATWIPFKKSLKNTIRNQTTINDITNIKQTIDIIYGTLDMLVIGTYLKDIAAENSHVKLHKIVAGHELTAKYASVIVSVITKA